MEQLTFEEQQALVSEWTDLELELTKLMQHEKVTPGIRKMIKIELSLFSSEIKYAETQELRTMIMKYAIKQLETNKELCKICIER